MVDGPGTRREEVRRPWHQARTALQTKCGAERCTSILFPDSAQAAKAEETPVPTCFADLDLDQILDDVLTGFDEYRLRPFFHLPLDDLDAVSYRHEVFTDLDGTLLARRAVVLADQMRSMRQTLVQATETQHRYQIRTWLLTAAVTYVDAVTGLLEDLENAAIASRGLERLRECLAGYVGSEEFQSLCQDMGAARDALSEVRYTLLFYDKAIFVRPFEDEADYGAAISSFFDRFRQGEATDHHGQATGPEVRNRLEEQVLDRVAALFPEAFAALDRFCDAHPSWLDELLVRFEREVQFYLAWRHLVERLRAAGLAMCFPTLSTTSRTEAVRSTYDLALALRLVSQTDDPESPQGLVTNDYRLSGRERIVVVTGPNQGGKTTFARAFGQLHWLASLGCPVPGAQARLFLADDVLSHFERGEKVEDMRGKLEDDLLRIQEILGRASGRSVVILNEIFSSTTLHDATLLSREILAKLSQLDGLVVCVTFIDELASFDHRTVSMVVGVDEADPTLRTFKLERRPADGRAYAVFLAERYGLSRERIKQRLIR